MRMSPFDPKKKSPQKNWGLNLKIRNKVIKAEIDLYEISFPSTTYDDVNKKFVFSSKWLPDQCCQRTQNRLNIHFPIHIIFNRYKALDIVEGKAPYKISTNDRITKTLLQRFKPIKCKPHPINIALKYEILYKQYNSMTAVAKEFCVTRVRICQMLNLLKLDKKIIEYLVSLTNQKEINYWTERKLRKLVNIPKNNQFDAFQELINKNRKMIILQ